jgi:hypothetical protein
MSASRFALVLAAASALAAPLVAHAASEAQPLTPFTSLPDPYAATNSPFVHEADSPQKATVDSSEQAINSLKSLYLDDAPAPAAEMPNIHGFFSSPFKTAYVTPRGLVVQNEGVVWQPVVGLVFPIGDLGPIKHFTFVGGIWNSVDTAEHDPFVGPWDEMDVFASFSGSVADVFSLTLTYSPWNSPPHAFHTEHNIDLKVGYDDSKLWGNSGFALNPYVDGFWAVSGDSTVILGRRGGTGYFEPGIAPTFTFKAVPEYPITLTLPIYTQIGPSTYWDRSHSFSNSVFGLVSASANLSVPLAFVPARYGHWHADLGVTYDYLINNALLHAGTLASGNTNHNVIIGSLGVGVNF